VPAALDAVCCQHAGVVAGRWRCSAAHFSVPAHLVKQSPFPPAPPPPLFFAQHRLELRDAPSRSHPSALHLHSAASFQLQHGYTPAAHATFLALVGKKLAGIEGTGLNDRVARKLVQR